MKLTQERDIILQKEIPRTKRNRITRRYEEEYKRRKEGEKGKPMKEAVDNEQK